MRNLEPKKRRNYAKCVGVNRSATNYKIQLRTSQIDKDSKTNHEMYQFVVIRGSSGRSRIPTLPNPDNYYAKVYI